MRLGFITDVHLANHRKFGGEAKAGINSRANLCLHALDKACAAVAKADCDALFILGDLFDGVRPEPQIIAAAATALEASDCTKYILRGNHEMVSADTGDHSLGPLEAIEDIHVIEETLVVQEDGWPVEVMCVPFSPGSIAERLPRILENAQVQGDRREGSPPASPIRLLALHAGLSDSKTEAWLRGSPDSIEFGALHDLMVKHRIQHTLSGHWHKHRAWEMVDPAVGDDVTVQRIVQLGALCPTGFGNPGAEGYGLVAIWDSAKPTALKYVEVPGPRFLVMHNPLAGGTQADVDVQKLSAKGNTVYVKLSPSEEHVIGAQEWSTRMQKAHDVAGCEIEPDAAEAECAARTAASVARSADTLAEALAAYVKEMPLAEGVDRAAVLERAKRYLEGGG